MLHYQDIHQTAAHSPFDIPRILCRQAAGLFFRLTLEIRVRRDIRRLRGFNQWQLRDIGIDRDEIDSFLRGDSPRSLRLQGNG